ncbi:MAG: hypothetical protein LBM13_04790 [Candidatus Ancillula sp.]|jgi:hypothetical protein|nr:hypothetical protein [Candidatus Ancillula sp.]
MKRYFRIVFYRKIVLIVIFASLFWADLPIEAQANCNIWEKSWTQEVNKLDIYNLRTFGKSDNSQIQVRIFDEIECDKLDFCSAKPLQMSYDFGKTWINSLFLEKPEEGDSWTAFTNVAISTTGETVIVCAGAGDSEIWNGGNGYVYISQDGGISWQRQDQLGKKDWHAVSLSKYGRNFAVAASGNWSGDSVWKGNLDELNNTKNNQVNWQKTNFPKDTYYSISTDGGFIIAGTSGGAVYLSDDFGVETHQVDKLPDYGNWLYVKIDPEENKIIAVDSNDNTIWTLNT